MKTLLSSGLIGYLSLALFACGGDDDNDVPDADASDSAASSSGETTTDAVDGAADVVESTSVDATSTDGRDTVNPEAQTTPTLEVVELSWRSCGQFQDRNLECAEVIVPIDYAQPDGETLSIALRRILANPLDPYKGALLINPGGPGGPGIDFALGQVQAGVFDAIAPGYDIVGFDPRGVGQSGERGCGILPEDLYPDLSDGPEVTSIVENQLALVRERGEQCEQAWGTLFHHLGSKNVVRDMDEIRKALKQPVLNYYGASYGTRLGALYAHTFPETTGRLVLDAAMLPHSTAVEDIRGQFYEVVRLHEAIFTSCEANLDVCPADSRVLFDQMLVNARAGGFEGAFLGLWRTLLSYPYGPDVIIAALNNQAADPGGAWFAYQWAPVMTEALGNATLLTSRHFGHGAVDLANECVISNVRAYLTNGSMPPAGAVCE